MTWTKVASAAELASQGVFGVTVAGEEIALYWIEGAPYATCNVCTHAFARLSDGFLDGECIECPIHQAQFNVKTGEAVAGPADEPVKTYPCRTESGDIWVDI